MERELDAMTASCDAARRNGHRDRVLLTESRIQSTKLQEEMRSDMEALTVRQQEANEQVIEVKTRLIGAKEEAVVSKARSDRQVAQLVTEKDGTVGAMRELQFEQRREKSECGRTNPRRRSEQVQAD